MPLHDPGRASLRASRLASGSLNRETDDCLKIGGDIAHNHDCPARTEAESACIARADSPEPDLGVRHPGTEALCRLHLAGVNLIGAGLDVDHDVFAAILRTHVRFDVSLVDKIASLGELFHAMTGLN